MLTLDEFLMNTSPSDASSSDSRSPTATPQHIGALSFFSLIAGLCLATGIDGLSSKSYVGRIESRRSSITVARLARLTGVHAFPGQHVHPGDKLFELQEDHLADQIIDKQREITELASESQRVRAVAEVDIEWRRRELQSEIFQTQLKARSVAQERLTKEVEQLAWQDHLEGRNDSALGPPLAMAKSTFHSISFDSNKVDKRRVEAMLKEDAAGAAAESLAAQLSLCEQRLENLQRLNLELPEKIRMSVGVQLSETRLSRAQEELTSLHRQRDSLTILSPAHGTVGVIHHRLNDLVQPGEPIVDLDDEDSRHVIADIPSSAVVGVRIGDTWTLIFPGKLKRLGLVAAIPPRATVDPSTAKKNESQIEIRIEPSGKLWPKVPIGTHVQVQVTQ